MGAGLEALGSARRCLDRGPRPPFPGLPLVTSLGAEPAAGWEAGQSPGGVGDGCVAQRRPRRPLSSQQPHTALACALDLVAHPARPPPPPALARRGPAGAGRLASRPPDRDPRSNRSPRVWAHTEVVSVTEGRWRILLRPRTTGLGARGAEPGAGGRRGRRSRFLRVAHPGPLGERGAGREGPSGVGACGCGRGISSRAERSRPAGRQPRGRRVGAQGREGKG